MPRESSATAAIDTPRDDLERSASCGLELKAAKTQPISETAMPIPETSTKRPAALLARYSSPASTLGGRPLRSGRTTMSATRRINRNLLCREGGERRWTGMGGAGTGGGGGGTRPAAAPPAAGRRKWGTWSQRLSC